jgi:hypothetical protein
MEPLIDAALALAGEIRTDLEERVRGFAREHLAEWQKVVVEVRSGEVDQAARRVPGNAFRPTFHSRQASDHLEAERWTEAFARYCMAGEFLVRDVILPEVRDATGLSDPAPAKAAWWRSAFLKIAAQLGLDVTERPEFKEFERIYGLRNTEILHGHREASMGEAVAAKRAFLGLQLLLAEMFAAEHGVSVEGLQDRALLMRTMLWTREEVERVQHFTEELGAVKRQAEMRFKTLVAGHRPAYPEGIARALAVLSPTERATADQVFAEALQEDFDLLGRIWRVATDGDALLADGVNQIESELR